MNRLQTLMFSSLVALISSSSSFAHDCRAIFDPGYSEEAKALLGKKFELVDETRVDDIRTVPFRIYVLENLDVDPETLTLKLTFTGETIIQDKRDSGTFHENVARTEKWLRDLPSCEKLYRDFSSK